MVDKVETTRTMAFQAWLSKDLNNLGWTDESPVMDAYVEPMDTWADMSELIVREAYPPSSNVRNISYFCGPMEGGIPPPAKPMPRQGPRNGKADLRQVVDARQQEVVAKKCRSRDRRGSTGSSVADIYHRANIDPSERYVLSVSGSTSARLTGHASGFSNLYPCGGLDCEWVECGMRGGGDNLGKNRRKRACRQCAAKGVWGYGDL